ncbi:hypothetical protein CEP54_010779 [Fusarium duplospermum]|uniref:DUF6536 domain-containing protein n=1 Tax=Fusarium duplospermum TaxID=1325734 RepID=A0A428PI46_9HYPO|nr:hypothetical protein CEP54_010779 [Fusarium duplospermum]
MATELKKLFHSGSSRLSLHSTDTNEEPIPSSRRRKFQSGWRFGLFAGAASCTVVFIVNLFALIWAVTRDEKNWVGQPILQEGPCSDMRYLNAGLHLIINALSSVLLAASNYGMQCISAPTRADVDKAHFKGGWLDIGVPIPVPYGVWAVQSTGRDINQSEFFNRTWSVSQDWERISTLRMKEKWEKLMIMGTSNKLTKLTNLECIRQYATSFQTSHQDVILVTRTELANLTDVATLHQFVDNYAWDIEATYEWVCLGTYSMDCPFQGFDGIEEVCRDKIPALESVADEWAPFCQKVEHCYSQPIDEKCQLTFSPTFIAFVLASNALKAAILLYIALKPPRESLFVLGDAVESFLTVADAFSSDSCLASVDDIKAKGHKDWSGARVWTPVKRRWAAAISRRRWRAGVFLYSVPLSVALFFLIFGIVRLPGSKDLKSLWRLGFGAVTEVTLITESSRDITTSFSMTESVILSNLPHFVFSGLYFQYNALFTGMLAAKEWSDFGRKRKGLRVSSDPRGEQKSRYFLQLPYRWSIPLILMSMLIHWMLSQSIFLVVIDFGDDFGTTCGYSPIAIFAVIIVAVAMALAVVIAGYRRLPTAIPVVGSCSLGIAAACHGLGGAERPDEALAPLRWGAMTHPEERSGIEEPGHCGFSGDYVDEPYEGGLYS